MPTSVSSQSNYAGIAAGRIIGKAFKEADTINKNLITIFENVNFKFNLEKLNYTLGKQPYSCGFNPTGTISLTEKVIEPIKVKVDNLICKETFRNRFGEQLMGESAWNRTLGKDVKTAIMAEALAAIAEDTDRVIWTGNNTTNPEEWSGFITQFAADSAVIVAADGVAVNATVSVSNVDEALANATALIPVSLRSKKDLRLIASPDVVDAYYKYLITNGLANGYGGDANTKLVYGRYPVIEVGGLPNNTIVIYQQSNLAFATGLLGDHNELVAVDEDEIGLMTGQVRFKAVYNGGVGYYNSDEVVYYDISA